MPLPKGAQPSDVKQAYLRIIQPRMAAAGGPAPTKAVAIHDLPIVEVQAKDSKSTLFAVIISGDGGWAGIDREIGAALAKTGVPVAGWNFCSISGRLVHRKGLQKTWNES